MSATRARTARTTLCIIHTNASYPKSTFRHADPFFALLSRTTRNRYFAGLVAGTENLFHNSPFSLRNIRILSK